MTERVVVTGLGVVSSLGIGWQKYWEGLLEGRSGIGPVSSFDTSQHFTHQGGEVVLFRAESFIPPELIKTTSRATQLALAAAGLAVDDARLSPEVLSRPSAAACVGTTTGSIHVIEAINDRLVKNDEIPGSLIAQLPTHTTAAAIARTFGLGGHALMISTACAAGNYAIGYGFDLIRLKRADVVICGGADAFSRISFTGFNQFKAVAPEKCQPFDLHRKGMMVAEGAGILILESLEHALGRGASVYAEIAGYGLSCDAKHMTSPSVEGISQCMVKAMTEAGISRDDVDYISAHGTGTVNNDRAECAAIRETFGPGYQDIPVSSIKSMLGHTMGAASALEAIACSLAARSDIIPPTINYETPDPECDIDCVPNRSRRHTVDIALNNSYAFGGNNACVVIQKHV
jgi:3-oxoacyl-[acyl-carrier-protein] synthase II